MSITVSLIMIGAFNLLWLIAAVYLIALLNMRYSIRIKKIDVLLLTVQVLNLALLSERIIGQKGFFSGLYLITEQLFIIQTFIILSGSIRFVQLLRKALTYRQKLLIPQSIHEAIDNLPGGICFSTPNGRPILTNFRMNELIYRLTAHTVINTKSTWEELLQLKCINGCTKLDNQWMNTVSADKAAGKPKDEASRIVISESTDNPVYFSFPDGSIWRFRKDELKDQVPFYTQLEATDITDLYRYSEDLYNARSRLAEQYDRQRTLLDNIVEINHEKEVLSAKMRIHDDMGKSILTTKQHIFNNTLPGNIPYLTGIWNNTVRNMTDFSQIFSTAEISPEIELLKVADMIGCHVVFHGDRPVGRKTELLFYAMVREALTNAVKHAGANQLDVIIIPTDRGYEVTISDNGSAPAATIMEGSGLGNLRKKLEQEGAELQIISSGGVVMTAILPAGKKDTGTQEAGAK